MGIFQIIHEFNRLTDFDLLHVLKEYIVGYADSIVRIKCSTDRGSFDDFKARMTDTWIGECKTCKYLVLIVFVVKLIINRYL